MQARHSLAHGEHMANDLFRREAIDHRRHRLYGEVALTSPLSTWIIAALLSAIVVAILAVFVLGSYARKETVSGWVTPDKGLARVSATNYAVVDKTHVHEGAVVEKGAPLLTLTQEAGLGSGRALVETMLAELAREEEALKARRALAKERAAAARVDLSARRRKMIAEIAELKAQQALQAERVAIANESLARFETLVTEDASSPLEVATQRQSALAETQGLNALAERALSTEQNLQQIEAALAASPNDEAAAIAELDGALAATAGRRAALARQGAEIVRAPVAGRIAALPAREGQSVSPQTLLAAILPEGGVLEAELFVPTRAAGFIREGQEARLQFDAFPFQKFGWGEGRVVAVSKTIYSPADIPPALAIQEPAFRIAVALDRPFVEAYGERYPVQAGMTLKADIVQEKRKLWRVLFDPLLAAARG